MRILIMDYKHRHQLYRAHKKRAKGRNILWGITYVQWIRIWLESGHWHERGRLKGQYVMARFGDKGPYAPWNVKIITCGENVAEAGRKRRHTDQFKTKMSRIMRGNTYGRFNKGRIGGMYGKKHNAETKRKMSIIKMGNNHTVGIKNGSAKLTEDNIREIRKMREKNLTQQAIAVIFNISQVMVGKIVRYESWVHVQ